MARLDALPYVRAGLSQGLTVTQALRDYREAAAGAGLTGMRTYDFQRLYSTIGAVRGQAEQALNADKDIPGGGLTPVQWPTASEPGYGHWVQTYQIERDSGALTQSSMIIKSDEIITPEEAEQRALAFLSTNPDQYNRRTIGVTFSGLVEMVPRGDVFPD